MRNGKLAVDKIRLDSRNSESTFRKLEIDLLFIFHHPRGTVVSSLKAKTFGARHTSENGYKCYAERAD